ncbi:SDR family oxidoreductase [Paralcaligenes ureilyticus]|uniref:dTDP-4-dehydrorhamnose reductase n=1 Tax=Paralcaligenes ureilyticus TaxID=627131 RepID=A0A4R3MC43_9BURK|nr:NAD(P)-dependent oxidoreductase [Paralcaligenes ureilyticus]TCT09035.1 dTDP-4-dehydrorhamnose reductase [Paralcaligenes ureilyticus]
MKVLLTGAGGQLGRCLQDRRPADWRLLAADHKTLDITDVQAVSRRVKQFQPQLIINAAAYTNVDQAESDRERAYAVNEHGARYLAQAARHAGARLIHISTDYVFDGEGLRPYVETDPVNPLNVYGRSKLAGEQAVLQECAEQPNVADHAQSGAAPRQPRPDAPSFIVLRTAWLYSEYGRNFVKAIVAGALQGQELNVVNDQIGAPTYAGNLAQAIIQIGRMPDLPGGVYHYSGSVALTRYEFARKVLDALGEAQRLGDSSEAFRFTPIVSGQHSVAASRPKYSVLDNGKIQKLGVKEGDGVDVCLRRMVAALLRG